MVTTPNYDLDVDTTLGGNNASDYIIPSQKAIKSYVDNNSGGGGTVDQTYDPTSQAAQSGVAIAGAGFLQNTATATNSLTVLGTTNNQNNSILIGYSTTTSSTNSTVIGNTAVSGGSYATALGYYARANGQYTTAIGHNSYANYQDVTAVGHSSQATAAGTLAVGSIAKASAQRATSIGYNSQATQYQATALGYEAKATANSALQIGTGTNNTANTLQVGSYTLLNTSTGLIPDARISSNIARTTDIPSLSGYLQNTATGADSLTLLGTITTSQHAINIGLYSSSEDVGAVALGYASMASGSNSVALGYSTEAIGSNSIQIGYGVNNTANTLSVGFFNQGNYQLLDGTTGLIPDARISTNIARTSDLSNYVQASNGNMTFVNAGTEGDILYNNSTTGEYYGVIIGQSSTYGTGVTIGAGNAVAQNGYMLNLTTNGFAMIDASNMGTALLTVSNNNLAVNGSEVVTGDNTRFDGQWVILDEVEVLLYGSSIKNSSATPLPKTVTLPDDNHVYEVMIRGSVTTSTTSGNYMELMCTSNECSETVFVCSARTRSNSAVVGQGTVIIPMKHGTDNLSIIRDANYNGTANMAVIGYRRLGTNT